MSYTLVLEWMPGDLYMSAVTARCTAPTSSYSVVWLPPNKVYQITLYCGSTSLVSFLVGAFRGKAWSYMSEKLDKLRASLEKEKERRIKINNRIESLERRIQEAEAAEVNEMVRTAKVTPEQLAALLRQSATSTPNPAALSAVGATIDKEDPDNEDDE